MDRRQARRGLSAPALVAHRCSRPGHALSQEGHALSLGNDGRTRRPDVLRVTLKGIGKAVRVGDLASLDAGNEPSGVCHGVTISDCGGGMVLRDVTIHCAPGMGIVESGGREARCWRASHRSRTDADWRVGRRDCSPRRGTASSTPTSAAARALSTVRLRIAATTRGACRTRTFHSVRCSGSELILAPRSGQKLATGDHLRRASTGRSMPSPTSVPETRRGRTGCERRAATAAGQALDAVESEWADVSRHGEREAGFRAWRFGCSAPSAKGTGLSFATTASVVPAGS